MPVSSQVVAGSSPESVMLPDWADDYHADLRFRPKRVLELHRYRIRMARSSAWRWPTPNSLYPQWKLA
ncbi:MAG: hypothetical protein R2845_01775 [Thermomicrobiales bacterium]